MDTGSREENAFEENASNKTDFLTIETQTEDAYDHTVHQRP
jgi:hypothetical protein